MKLCHPPGVGVGWTFSGVGVTAGALAAESSWLQIPSLLATMDDSLAAQKVMVAQLPTKGVATIYSRIGDLFAWLCIIGLVGAIVLGLFA